jgi:hypothetical protein
VSEKILFIVEFGEAVAGSIMSSYNSQSPIYVVASNYNEAAEKATIYIEHKKSITSDNNILMLDGSLDNAKIKEMKVATKIKSIRIAGDEIVW